MQKSQRLIELMMVINMKKNVTVNELAEEFGISPRTITRDLRDLSELGFPIYSVQGRGGGYRLLRDRMLPPIGFLESEAIAIFLACQSLQYFGSLPFEESSNSALRKFYHYLPADVKEQIGRLKDKVVIWNPHRSMSSEDLGTLLKAVMTRSVVTIRYRSSEQGDSSRDIQPIGLYASNGYWYCPAYCFMRKTYRLFRADRIESAALNPAVPFREDVDRRTVFDWEAPKKEQMEQTTFVVRLTPRGVAKLEPNGRFEGQVQRLADGSGEIRMSIPVNDLSFYCDMIWEIGEDATIVEPEQAVTGMKDKIERMRSLYA